ncbi:F-box/kelch-repeat protein At3g06240-like [Lycium ferocissimum]|uniref:F-box/kelch-repeat protein At3g06240-like n=1 Tax=Lycium ferocissimum TaxID=112874 RepID=UPI00281664CD|nr:F-box/kelch-repeat protein At3g06240-like [Lycium ferocissimum]
MGAKNFGTEKLTTLMEPEGDEAYHQHPKMFKPTNNTQFPSTSSNKDSILTNPILPQELITAILVRLPVKSLLQFKCVSKDWFSLISSPSFIRTHLSFSVKNCTHHRFLLISGRHIIKHCSFSSLFNESSIKALDLDYTMKTPYNSVHIVGSVNGLICFLIGLNGLVLWDPSTRKFKQVVTLMSIRKYFLVKVKYGFGYDEVHDDYKVVSIFIESKNRYDANIYSLKSDSWRTLDDFQGKVESTSLASR